LGGDDDDDEGHAVEAATFDTGTAMVAEVAAA